jgi:hypothetical protein
MTARQAMRTLDALHLTAVVTGSGTVVRQNPRAGSPEPIDGRVVLELEPGGGAPLAQTQRLQSPPAARARP